MSDVAAADRLVQLRRDLHRHPEPAWCEFYTTARILRELDRIGVDELHLGRDVLDPSARSAVPAEATLAEWRERALAAGATEDELGPMGGGFTGAIAVLRRGEGPTIALRVDIDALPQEESDSPDHRPAAEGFRATTPAMHACGHDAHATIGVGVLEAIANSDFAGTLKVIFQPAEEVVGGGAAVAESGHLDDVDYLLAVHIGLDHPTGEVVAGIGGILAVSHFHAAFEGEPAHAGGHPDRGRNAVQALASAIQNLYAIPRHGDGATRVNAGIVEGGEAANIIPEHAHIEGEIRGETTELREYMAERAETVIRGAAATHDCDSTFGLGASAPGAESDDELAAVVADVAHDVEGIDTVLDRDDLGGSEDVTELMRAVQQRGGLASFVGIGTDHPGGHHTATFDVDEASLRHGVDVLTGSIQAIARSPPLGAD